MQFIHLDKRIDQYIATLPEWQQEVCHAAREYIPIAEPQIIETIKRTKLPYFTFQGNDVHF